MKLFKKKVHIFYIRYIVINKVLTNSIKIVLKDMCKHSNLLLVDIYHIFPLNFQPALSRYHFDFYLLIIVASKS